MALDRLNVPLQGIVDHEGNVYELTNAAIKRAAQLAITGGATVDECGGKFVSAALTEVVNKKVNYHNESLKD